ncbi:TIGR03085 family metal-binding protein [Actinomadura sp. WAC 06369]|uniref:TIGR03085 family metal-binding protein n=1 Tax=Actinomadura sp. WAC 06369 TaxID=2203193 RepID=UPI000F78DB08|nr:TIGR03085 family metal-binding protein [Actinomadura sp. WAC 06369]RSN50423.1 TIGR03085 family protein [Actinomadura sp. WAC 06369]
MRSTAHEGPARRERRLLADALAAAGPGAPTLCEGWDARDLAAHLVVREGRPDAAAGILLPPLSFYEERVRSRAADVPFDRLVDRFRHGPPKYSPFALPGMEENANAVEFFVHHEDVRRAGEGAEPREISPDLERVLWRRIRIARFVLRNVHVEVTFVRPDGQASRVSRGPRGARAGAPGASGGAAGAGSRGVRVHGPVGELVLWALGRRDAADVRLEGDTDSVKTLTETGWSL